MQYRKNPNRAVSLNDWVSEERVMTRIASAAGNDIALTRLLRADIILSYKISVLVS